MPQIDTKTAGEIVSQNANNASNTVTVTLLTPPTGMCNLIKCITCYAVAATIADVHITKSDATSIARIGGAGIGILSGVLLFSAKNDPRGGLPGYAADGTLVVFTTTNGTSVECTVVYEQVPA